MSRSILDVLDEQRHYIGGHEVSSETKLLEQRRNEEARQAEYRENERKRT